MILKNKNTYLVFPNEVDIYKKLWFSTDKIATLPACVIAYIIP